MRTAFFHSKYRKDHIKDKEISYKELKKNKQTNKRHVGICSFKHF